MKQNYNNYKFIDGCIFCNNVKSKEVIKKIINNDDRFILVENEEKKCSLQNICEAVQNYSEEEDIIVILDGDDFLYGDSVLTRLNEEYNKHNCWLTYGSYISLTSKTRGKFAKKLPDYIIEKSLFREYEWCTSHLRTFKSFLFKSINKEDLTDAAGAYYNMAGDLVIMFPMLEMAGNKSHYVNDLMYIWNDTNMLNEHKVNHVKQLSVEKIIRGMNKYDRLIR